MAELERMYAVAAGAKAEKDSAEKYLAKLIAERVDISSKLRLRFQPNEMRAHVPKSQRKSYPDCWHPEVRMPDGTWEMLLFMAVGYPKKEDAEKALEKFQRLILSL